MGSLKEIGDFLRDAKGTIKEMKCRADDIKGLSIAKQSSAATLQFPIIMSRSINVDTAMNVTKALERQYANFVQLTIALNPVINWNEEDIPGFINRIHQNNPTPLDIIESCINVYSDEELGLRMITSINEGCNGQVLRSNKEQMFNIEDHLNQNKLNDLYKPNQITLEQANASLDYFMLTEAKHRPKKDNGKTTYKSLDEFGKAYNAINQGENPEPSSVKGFDPKTHKTGNSYRNDWEKTYKRYANGGETDPNAGMLDGVNSPKNNPTLHSKLDEVNKKYGKTSNNFNKNIQEPNVSDPTVTNGKATASAGNKKSNNKLDKKPSKDETKLAGHNNGTNKHEEIANAEREKREEEAKKAELKLAIDKANSEHRARAVVKLSDNDVKKSNELVPTTLSVTLQQTKGDNFGGNINFILGVKGLMHPVNSDEMVSNLLDGYKAGNKFFNFLRWTSGEISFLKDLLLNIDGIKEDVIRKHSKGSHWWTTLKRNRTIARTRNISSIIAKKDGRILPNATIVCSMEEVMEIKDTYNVDLMDPRNIAKIMDRYFLLGFVIVDESQELCYFMFDGEREYAALSFKGLERENNNKNDFKDIYKMINAGRL